MLSIYVEVVLLINYQAQENFHWLALSTTFSLLASFRAGPISGASGRDGLAITHKVQIDVISIRTTKAFRTGNTCLRPHYKQINLLQKTCLLNTYLSSIKRVFLRQLQGCAIEITQIQFLQAPFIRKAYFLFINLNVKVNQLVMIMTWLIYCACWKSV